MDDLVATPFAAGLPLAVLLPLIGLWLRLRGQWLAFLGLAHVTAAGALVGSAVHLSGFAGGLAGALVGVGVKHIGGGRSNSSYGLMILAGWALTMLIAANTPLGEGLAHALIDGQLYFAGERELIINLVVLLLVVPLLSWFSARLIAARLFPDGEQANGLPAWRWHLGFDFIVALALAAATTTIGLMGSFALIFVPPWIAFRDAANWRHGQWLAVAIGLAGYGTAYGLALLLDQPFGPMLAALLVLGFGLTVAFAKVRRRHRRGRSGCEPTQRADRRGG